MGGANKPRARRNGNNGYSRAEQLIEYRLKQIEKTIVPVAVLGERVEELVKRLDRMQKTITSLIVGLVLAGGAVVLDLIARGH